MKQMGWRQKTAKYLWLYLLNLGFATGILLRLLFFFFFCPSCSSLCKKVTCAISCSAYPLQKVGNWKLDHATKVGPTLCRKTNSVFFMWVGYESITLASMHIGSKFLICPCMFLRWVAVISQLDHKCTWWCSHRQSWLQNLGQWDSILMSCPAQDPVRPANCINLRYLFLYIP